MPESLYTTPRPRRIEDADSPIVWQFTSAEEALYWSADVLRSRRSPKLTILWQYVLAEALEPTAGAPARPAMRLHLPNDPDDRHSLAIAVDALLMSMGEAGQLLRLHAWGDWASEGKLNGALRIQEQERKLGNKLLLNHRLSFRQLGLLLGHDHKTIAKQVRQAFTTLAERLQMEGLLFIPHSGD